MELEQKQGASVSTFESSINSIPSIEELLEKGPKAIVTENQLKVMENKYLRGESVELWLRRIARNIALAELLYTKEIKLDEILEGTYHEILNYDYDTNSHVILLQKRLPDQSNDTRWKNFLKFEENLMELASKNPVVARTLREKEDKFYNMLSEFDFLPNSPCLMNAGRELQMLHACFRGDQPIMTADGIKHITDIKKGELVLTASGRYKKVVETMERFSESYRIINIWKMPNETLCVTDDHPILCLNQETNKSVWKSASEISTEDYVATSYPKETIDKNKIFMMDFLDSNHVVKKAYIYKLNKDKKCYNKQIKPIKAEIEIDYDLMKIFGYYLSEGDIDNENAIRFTFNSNEINYMQDLIQLMEKKFGISSAIKKSNFGNWSNVRFFSRALVKMFKSILGEGFNKKFVSSWILKLPIEKQKGLLAGMLRGDGYPTLNKHTTNIRAVLSNSNLVYSLWAISVRMGLFGSFKKDNLQELSTTNPYRFNLDGHNSEQIFDDVFVGKEFNGITQLSMRRAKEKYLDGTFYLPVKDIKVVMEPIKVYNFEVEEEHTYVANNIAVHNCYVIPVPDSMEGIMKAVTAQAFIQQSGGGTGFAFSRLRPEGDIVKSTKGIASGPMSFIKIFDTATDVVRQGGCVDVNTRVSTEQGLVRIKEIVPKEIEVNSWAYHNNGTLTVMTDSGPKISDEVYNNGKSEVITIQTKNGYSVTATPEHRFRVIDENGDYVWKHLKDIKKGDWLALQLHNYPEIKGYKLPEFKHRPHFNSEPIILPEYVTIGLGEIFGYFVGDGAISVNKRGTGRFILSFGDDEPEVKEYIHRHICNAFGILPSEYKKKNDNSTNSYYCRTTLVHWLKHIGVNKSSALKAEVPEIVFRAGKDFAYAFLRGLFTADGTISKDGYASLSSASEKLIDDCQQLLLSLGIPSGKSIKKNIKNRYGVHTMYLLRIVTERGLETFKEKIGFLSEKKNRRLKTEKTKWEFNDVIPNQENKLKQIYNGPGRGCAPGKLSKGANRKLYRTIQHYLPGVKAKRNFTYKRLKVLAEKFPEIKSTKLTWFLENNQFYDQVRMLKKGEAYTLDLSVPENNTYIANGFVSHNTRRGANMGILYYKHPDIRKFITSKSKDRGFLWNFNISVALDEDFIKAVENDKEIELINPKTKEVVGRENAREIWDLMAKCAWETGDPGFVVIDRINETESNPTPNLGQIESTNPCGEQPLLPWEPCTLGSINLSNHIKTINNKTIVDYEKLAQTVKTAVNFLDNVVDMSNYALSEIEFIAKTNRRIGLGVMGWAEMLVKIGISYNSEEALTLAEELMSFINTKALEASEELAETRGVFFNHKDSIYDKTGKYFRGKSARPRNCARTTIAPTGTIAIAAGLQGSGIEPFFAIAYKRYQAEALEKLRQGKEPDKKHVYYEVIPLFLETAEKNNWFGLDKESLMKKIVDNNGSIRGIKEIPERIQEIFVSSHDTHWRTHINHQAAFQKATDNAVSKTINMANTVTVQEIQEAYMYAYKTGCKGVTVYRDGCKEVQVLSTGITKKQVQKTEEAELDMSKGVSSDYYEINTGYGPLHVNIVYDKDTGPLRMFTSIPPIGTELSSLTSVLGIFLSKAFQRGYDPQNAIKHLNSAKGDRPLGFGPNKIESIPHAIAKALKTHLEKTGKIGDKEQMRLTELTSEVKKQHCSQCYSPNVDYISGCSEPTCLDCGYSKCS